MKRIFLFLLFACSLPAYAQTSNSQGQPAGAKVIATCGTASLTTGTTGTYYMDATGMLCVNGSGGGAAVGGATETTQLSVLAELQSTAPVAVNNAAAATGGATVHSVISAANNNSTNIKGSAGTVYHVFATNTSTSLRYIRLYNTTSAPTCSSATGILWRGVIPPATAAGQVGGIAVNFTGVGGAFGTGIGYCITTTVSDTDNNSIGAGEVVLDILWQ